MFSVAVQYACTSTEARHILWCFILYSVRILQSLFAKSLEQVNLDVAFFEEQQNTNTVAYMLIWKLLTEAMAVCQAEVRRHGLMQLNVGLIRLELY